MMLQAVRNKQVHRYCVINQGFRPDALSLG